MLRQNAHKMARGMIRYELIYRYRHFLRSAFKFCQLLNKP